MVSGSAVGCRCPGWYESFDADQTCGLDHRCDRRACIRARERGVVPGSLVWRIAAGAAFVAILWFVVLRGPAVDQVRPSRVAVRTYGVCVAAMVVAIPVGAAIISNILDKPDAVVVWVVFVVGAHFLPFAHAFGVPVFRWLAVSLIVVAVVAAVSTLAFDSVVVAGWTGVVAGFVLLFFAAVGPRLTRVATTQPA